MADSPRSPILSEAVSGKHAARGKGFRMDSREIRQGVVELRSEAFRLAEELARQPTAAEAATEMQSVAYLLGQVERLTTRDILTAA
jgi:hypothetical protein